MTATTETVYVNSAAWDGPPLSDLAGATVYNAPRPLLGSRTWTGDFRHGVFYAAVREDDPWEWHQANKRDDGWLVAIVTNDDVRAMLEAQLAEAGYSLADYAEIGMSVADAAADRGLPWVDSDN